MVGIFGNHPFDRQMERDLMIYLDESEHYTCPHCEFEGECDKAGYDESTNKMLCENCEEPVD